MRKKSLYFKWQQIWTYGKLSGTTEHWLIAIKHGVTSIGRHVLCMNTWAGFEFGNFAPTNFILENY